MRSVEEVNMPCHCVAFFVSLILTGIIMGWFVCWHTATFGNCVLAHSEKFISGVKLQCCCLLLNAERRHCRVEGNGSRKGKSLR